ncbi:MAG TPA: hypothetical protein EYQ50_15540 [Verrucomicrobiales bacterium]|nr:hypothetical protein [Verrucomicrobiales bacterium]
MNYKSSHRNQIKYKLEGFDEEWHTAGKEQAATYTNLDPGKYRLLVHGSNDQRVWNENGVMPNLVVIPPWWRTGWFQTALLLGTTGILICIGWVVSRSRMRQLVESAESEKLLAQEREQILIRRRQTQKMEAIGTLAGGIAHDFNNILTGIFGYLDLIKLNENLEPQLLGDIEWIELAADRAKSMVQRILTYSRTETLSFEPMVLPDVILDSLKLLRVTLPTTVKIKNQVSLDFPVFFGSPSQINLIILNLDAILLHIKFSDLNLGILHKLDAGQNMVTEGGRAEAVHGK